MDYIIETISNILNTFSGLPDYYIFEDEETITIPESMNYCISFADGVLIHFVVTWMDNLQMVAKSIYNRYLDESCELGMNCK
jgi:hypothetical protein